MTEKTDVHFRQLTQLQYSGDTTGPWKLYVFNRDGFHRGGQWFGRVITYPNDEITITDAEQRVKEAVAQKLEVRICDGGDMLVFHSKDGVTLYGDGFWQTINS